MDPNSDAANVTSCSGNVPVQHGMSDDAMSLSSVKEFFSCPYSSCNFSTAWKSSLNMHMKTHTGESWFIVFYFRSKRMCRNQDL